MANNKYNPNTARPNTVRPNAANTTVARPNTANVAYAANAYPANYDPSKPNYVMRKSAWAVIRPWHILLGVLIIPLLIMFWKIINVKDETISFYNNKVVHKRGWLNRDEKTTVLTRVLSVRVRQTFWGRIFNYGTIYVDMMGKWDISMRGIKNPMGAKAYLEKFVANGSGMRQILTN